MIVVEAFFSIIQNMDGPALVVFVGWLVWRTTRQDSREGNWVHEELSMVRERLARLETRERAWLGLLAVHSSWDARAAATVQQINPSAAATLGEPPPLYPPDSGGPPGGK